MIEDAFIPHVKSAFEKRSELQSALLVVAQYWADEADDAVHASVVFSARETPVWPHICEYEREYDEDFDEENSPPADLNEVCSSCGENLGWLGFNDNGEDMIAAFGPCCLEGANQEMRMADAYLPYAVARRSWFAKNGIEVEIIGGPIRAWMDDESLFPRPVKRRSYDERATELFDLVYSSRKGTDGDASRQVLADYLQQKGEPLGEYITLSYALAAAAKEKRAEDLETLRTRAAQLEMRYGRSWLGALAQVAPAEYVTFDRGFVRAVAVYLLNEQSADAVAKAREWGTIQRLRFLPGSLQRLSEAMTSLQFVGTLDQSGLEQLGRVGQSLPIERVHVGVEDSGMMQILADLSAPPSLQCLIVSAPNLLPSALESLRTASYWPSLSELVITSLDADVVGDWVSLPSSQRPKILSFTGLSTSTKMTAGFRIRFVNDVATVDMPSLNAATGVGRLGEALAPLPTTTRIEIQSSRLYKPSEAELEILTRLAKRVVTVR